MSNDLLLLLPNALWETLIMVGASGALATLFGIPLGVLLAVTDRGRFLENAALHRSISAVVNATRSTPFIILMVAIIPLTRLIAGTSIGLKGAIVPLTIAATPFVGRLTENALREVDAGLIEAARAMGADPRQIVFKVILAEARPGIVAAIALAIINLINFSAMAGAVGGGGLGDLGIRYGYERFRPDVMAATVVILIVLVALVQLTGDRIVRRIDHR